jgi:hypothetical protein
MKTLRKMPVFGPAKLGFRALIWMLVAIVVVLLISFLSPSKAGAQNLAVESDTTVQNPELVRYHLWNSSLSGWIISGFYCAYGFLK